MEQLIGIAQRLWSKGASCVTHGITRQGAPVVGAEMATAARLPVVLEATCSLMQGGTLPPTHLKATAPPMQDVRYVGKPFSTTNPNMAEEYFLMSLAPHGLNTLVQTYKRLGMPRQAVIRHGPHRTNLRSRDNRFLGNKRVGRLS